MPIIRLVLFAVLTMFLTGCLTVVEVEHHGRVPTGYLSDGDKRRAAINYYGLRPELTRQEIVGERHRVTERMLLQSYYVPRDIMCYRKYVPGGSRAIFCSNHRQLDYLLRSYQYGYGPQTARFTLLPEHSYYADPVYTSFSIGRGYRGYGHHYRPYRY